MRESGYYPAGAQYDPRAPFNQPNTHTCKRCEGNGSLYYAYNIKTGAMTQVNYTTWKYLPDDEDAAAARGEVWCRDEETRCPYCDGSGQVEDT